MTKPPSRPSLKSQEDMKITDQLSSISCKQPLQEKQVKRRLFWQSSFLRKWHPEAINDLFKKRKSRFSELHLFFTVNKTGCVCGWPQSQGFSSRHCRILIPHCGNKEKKHNTQAALHYSSFCTCLPPPDKTKTTIPRWGGQAGIAISKKSLLIDCITIPYCNLQTLIAFLFHLSWPPWK